MLGFCFLLTLFCVLSVSKDKRKDAVKKVIAAMTVGKDVSSLFTDVVNCMQTENLELKKLVYLYLINYAKSQPDLAILAVNTFVKVNSSYWHSAILLFCSEFGGIREKKKRKEVVMRSL